MYTTEDTHHFPAYGVAPDYWAQRALGSNHGPPLALAPNFATERLLASESLLREREQATAHAERRNASREKQLSDHTVKLYATEGSNPNPNPNPNQRMPATEGSNPARTSRRRARPQPTAHSPRPTAHGPRPTALQCIQAGLLLTRVSLAWDREEHRAQLEAAHASLVSQQAPH